MINTDVKSSNFILYTFGVTLFTSALLLFWIQPLIAKMLLPYLGGTPAVWNTCMMFFQGTLLAGYIYAYLSIRFLGAKRQAILHFILILIVLVFLPVSSANFHEPLNGVNPIVWILKTLFQNIAAPLLLISASAPMLQMWFSKTKHSYSNDPYFLYAASNLGSMIALLSFPIFFEPNLSLQGQSYTRMGIYILLIALIGMCAFLVKNNTKSLRPSKPLSDSDQMIDVRKPNITRRLHWLILTLVPSSLLLGLTTYITTDIAAVPLFWILPFALYLLTFILVFSRKILLPQMFMVIIQPYVLFPLLLALVFIHLFTGVYLSLTIHLVAFFVTCMVCHGELVKSRPEPNYLTEFYLWIALGGLLGGVFNVLIAPHIFNHVFEYPLILAIACFLRPRITPLDRTINIKDILIPVVLLLLLNIPFLLWEDYSIDTNKIKMIIMLYFIGSLISVTTAMRVIRFGLCISVVLFSGVILNYYNDANVMLRARSFYGTIKVKSQKDIHYLIHGNTVHGLQSFEGGKAEKLNKLYGPIGEIFAAAHDKHKNLDIAIAGLGPGLISCYAADNDTVTYYEIDPKMVTIAKNKSYFTYLTDCEPKGGIVIGDARLMLAKVKKQKYDLLILDAFSSASIPVHLLTKEAFTMYLEKLKDDGLIAVNISNRYISLEPLIAALADEFQLNSLIRRNWTVTKNKIRYRSKWLILTKDISNLMTLYQNENWQDLKRDSVRVWTDDYSNLLAVIR